MAIALVEHRDGRFVLMVKRESGEIGSVEIEERAVQLLLFSASRALGEHKGEPAGDPLMQPPMIDAEPAALSTGSDDQGRAVLTVQLPLTPPMRFRFNDDMARGIVENFREILEAPADVRRSMKPN